MEFRSIDTNDDMFHQAMRLYNDTFPKDIRESEEVFHRSLELKELDHSKYHFIAALKDNSFAGFISFHLETEYHIGYIVYLVVDPRFRGQHISRELMHEAERIMTSYDPDLHYIILECEKDSDGKSPLEPFYAKFDFYPLEINYVQPGLHGGAPVPMNLFLKTIHSEPSPSAISAIQHIYSVKYSQANKIDKSLLEQYSTAF